MQRSITNSMTMVTSLVVFFLGKYELDEDGDAVRENHQDNVFIYEDFSHKDTFALGIQTDWQLATANDSIWQPQFTCFRFSVSNKS
jgi:hypothetical protein